MSYDHWKTTNIEDADLYAEPASPEADLLDAFDAYLQKPVATYPRMDGYAAWRAGHMTSWPNLIGLGSTEEDALARLYELERDSQP